SAGAFRLPAEPGRRRARMKKPARGPALGMRRSRYFDSDTMYCTTALMSVSLALDPPLGGIAPLPLMALAVRPSTPCARRGAQAALSPTFGALATPLAWQTAQVWA